MTLEILIAGLAVPEFMYFMAWAFLGQLLMVLVQIKRGFKKIKNDGGFQLGFWLMDNKYRILFSFLSAIPFSVVAVLVVIKAPDGLTEFACVGAGAMIDKTVESFTNKKK